MFRKTRYIVARLYEVRASMASDAGRLEKAARLSRRAEEIFQGIDAIGTAEGSKDPRRADGVARPASAEVPRA